MRIARLDLTAFGSFSATTLDFEQKTGSVELVYGPNEAGKSTTLRAISGLLFGIPERTRDGHRHAPADLRVGGVLVGRHGDRLEVVRRKGRKATLRDREDRPVDEALLSTLLGGASPELFESLFGLTHDGLRASAEALLAGRGQVGESLFSAGVGGRGVHDLRVRLAREAEELFVARARERRVNKAISELKEARDTVRNAATSPAKYLEQLRAYEEAAEQCRALSDRRTTLAAEQARLRRLVAVLPDLRRRADLISRLAALGHDVNLPPDAASLRRRAAEDLAEATREGERAASRAANVRRELSELEIPESLVAVDDATIKDLIDRRGGFLRAEADRPGLEAKAMGIEASVAASLQRFGISTDATALRVSIQSGARIRYLANRQERVDERLGATVRSLAEARARRDHIATRLSAAADDARRKSVKAGLERAAELPVPTPEAVDRFAEAWDKVDSERARIARERDRTSEKRRNAERRLDELRRMSDVPSENDLQQSRAARDALWAEIRSTLARAGMYEEAVAHADDIADRLRREADRVAQRAGLETELAAAAVDGERLAGEARALDDSEKELGSAWSAEWNPVGLAPKRPPEMRAWVRDFRTVVEIDGEIAALAAQEAAVKVELDGIRKEWGDAVAALGLRPESTRDEAFAVLDATTELGRLLDKAEGLRGRIAGIHRDSSFFARDVAALCRMHLPEAERLPPADAAQRLLSSFEQAQNDRATKRRLESELSELEAEQALWKERSEDASARLTALFEAAGATDLATLEQAERRAAEQGSLRKEIRAAEEQLALSGDGAALPVLEAEAKDVDLDQARARIRDLERDVEEISELIDQSKADMYARKHGVENMERTDAAEASAVLEHRVAVLKRHVHRYVRVRLAASILEREIERYRRENQGPILSRAGELFPRLTLGRYSGLRVGLDDDGEAVLECLRGDGTPVKVEGLSEATRDGLYLALRLASLERYADANEPMPLILDDVLIQFDDDRARAALEVLGEVARTTQILFFTHHARLVELARAALGPERLSEHALPGPVAPWSGRSTRDPDISAQ
jgi:uncharacterized protein YhaN